MKERIKIWKSKVSAKLFDSLYETNEVNIRCLLYTCSLKLFLTFLMFLTKNTHGGHLSTVAK